jgi:hypothetical protein
MPETPPPGRLSESEAAREPPFRRGRRHAVHAKMRLAAAVPARNPAPARNEAVHRRGIRVAGRTIRLRLRFLDDGRLPIHNNSSERALRREAIGRKNWLFVGTDDAPRSTPPSSPCSRAASSTMSSPGPISATSSASCPAGPCVGSWSSPLSTGRRPPRTRTLSSAWPPTSSGRHPSASSTTITPPSSTHLRCRQRRYSPNAYPRSTPPALQPEAPSPGIKRRISRRATARTYREGAGGPR